MNENRQNTTLLTVIAVATLLVAVVGATFAYFTAAGTNNSTSTIETTGGKIGITYADQSAWMEAENIEPNTNDHVTFKRFLITANYDVKLDIPFSIVFAYNTKFSYPMYVALTDNTSTNKDKYSFNGTLPTYNKETGEGTMKLEQADKAVPIVPKSESESGRTAVPGKLTVASGKFLGNTPGEYSIDLTMEIFYPDNGSIQDEDKLATFEGKVSVVAGEATVPSAA